MITAEQVLYNLHLQLHPKGQCERAFCSHRGLAAKLAPLVHDMIKAACAETAEDTRERMVAAAGRALERKECAYPHLHHGDGRGCETDDCPRHSGGAS